LITIRIYGGLGNQLFQIFAARHLAQLNNTNLQCNLDSGGKGAFQHLESLEDLTFQFMHKNTVIQFNSKLYTRISHLISRKFPELYLKFSWAFKDYKSSSSGFDPFLSRLPNGQFLEGYFQSYKYVANLVSQDPKAASVQPKKTGRVLDEYIRLIEIENPIVIHVRRGDYVGNLGAGLLSSQYYADAIYTLNGPQRNIWVFSDDIQAAKEEFSKLSTSNWRWIGSSELTSPSQNLYLMSLAKDIVIANSTFSWWGAMLNQKKNVVAPEKWSRNQEDPRDLYPPEWKTIQSFWVE